MIRLSKIIPGGGHAVIIERLPCLSVTPAVVCPKLCESKPSPNQNKSLFVCACACMRVRVHVRVRVRACLRVRVRETVRP